NLDNFVDYDSFISKYMYLKDKEDSSLTFTNNLEKRNDEYYFELTSDQKKNFGEARYIVFEKTSDNLYRPVISSNEYKLEGNVIKTKLDNKIVKITDTIANESVYLPVTINKNGKTVIPVTINNTKSSDSSLWSIENGMFYIGENNNKIDYQIVLTSKEKAQGVSGAVLGKDDFTSLDFPYSSYNILDENGNYKENWDKNKTLLIFEVKQNGFKLERESLDKNKEYYIVFRITDVYGNVSYTKLLKM
nr:hypothetical protein [Bacilli bacterium]